MKPNEKRKQFFKEHPEIYSQYLEIKQEISENADNTKKLEMIKSYAINHTSFYKGYSVSDTFPVMTKLDFISHYDEIKSNENFVYPLHYTSTSGSTGIPFTVPQNSEKRARVIAELKAFGEYADYPSHEKMLQLRAYNGKQIDRQVDERESIYRYDICNLSNDDIEKLVQFILEFQPRTIFGYASTINTITEYIYIYIYIYGKKLKFPFLKSILTGSETLNSLVAEKIQNVFGCPVFDRYSDMEMGIFAQREYNKTDFILNTSSYYFEILHPGEDKPVAEGEPGRIVITDLYNHAFPMIRYDTGDIGTFCVHDGKVFLKEIYGRKVDNIYSPKGMLLSPHCITNIMWGAKNIIQWQFIQKKASEYVIKINKSGAVDENDILNRLYSALGNKASISIQYEDNIPPVPNSQKRRYIINEMNQ